ncbi:MAG: cyclic nucleotide-binding domain-containing protein [Bacteroidia bacterium]|nr:cyclic nucleotide-binding domain-containing protein [Bacteroidia bacterium]
MGWGKFFGEMALLGKEDRNLTAISVMETRVWKLKRMKLFQVFSEEAVTLAEIIQRLTERLMKQNISTLANIKLKEKELLKENGQLKRDLEELQEELDLVKRKLKTANAKIQTSGDKKLYLPLSKSFINAINAMNEGEYTRLAEEIQSFRKSTRSEIKKVKLSDILDENIRNAYLSFQSEINSTQILIQREYSQNNLELTLNKVEFGGVFQNILDFIFDNLQRKSQKSAFDYIPKLTVSLEKNAFGNLIRFKFNGIKISTQNFDTTEYHSFTSPMKSNSDYCFDLFTCGLIVKHLYHGKLMYLGEESLNTMEWYLGDQIGSN